MADGGEALLQGGQEVLLRPALEDLRDEGAADCGPVSWAVS